MMWTLLFTCITTTYVFSSKTEETVFLIDLNKDANVRNLETALPQYLDFNLRRQSGTVVSLRLEENIRLNFNAPVYETVLENDREKAVRVDSPPIVGVKFYQDKRHGAAVQVYCATMPDDRACQRVLEGSLYLNDESFEIVPSPAAFVAREMKAEIGVPHTLIKVGYPPSPQEERQLGPYGTDFKLIPDGKQFLDRNEETRQHSETKLIQSVFADKRYFDSKPVPHGIGEDKRHSDSNPILSGIYEDERYSDSKPIPPGIIEDKRYSDSKPIPPGIFEDKRYSDSKPIPSGINEDKRYSDAKPIPSGTAQDDERSKDYVETLKVSLKDKLKDVFASGGEKRQTATTYTVEVLMVVDTGLWEKHDSTASSTSEAETSIRRKLSHVMNGVSLRYESIEDPRMNVSVTISGFLFYKVRSNQNYPQPYAHQTITSGSVVYADSDVYIDTLVGWARRLYGLPENDHIMVVTSFELFYGGDIRNSAVVGVAYVGGVCGDYRVSVQQDGSYFFLTSVAAHELGHNLGAHHDGSAGTQSESCPASNKNIMAPYLASFQSNEVYSPNPWKFSECSVLSFINFFERSSCLKDPRNDAADWKTHTKSFPGEWFTAEQQCELAYGKTSYLCTSKTDERICLVMGCYRPLEKMCRYEPAADGTPCGSASANKWCWNGECVKKSITATTTRTPTTKRTTLTTTTTTTTSTTTSTTTTTSSQACTDKGWNNWPCKELNSYFKNHGYPPSTWCREPVLAKACCRTCSELAQCFDTGYGSWDCPKLSENFKFWFNIEPQDWCKYSAWQSKCCEFCRKYGW